MPKKCSKFGKPPSCWNLIHACPRPESDFCLTPPPGIQPQPPNAAETEAPLRRAASQTTRSRVYPGFIPHAALSSPHAHHLDEETARIAALPSSALPEGSSPGSLERKIPFSFFLKYIYIPYAYTYSILDSIAYIYPYREISAADCC